MNRRLRRAAARSERRVSRKAAALGSAAVLASAGAGAAVVLTGGAAGANAPLVVDSLADDGTGFTLREAIDQANTDPGQDQITFSVTGTITLTSDLPTITEAVHINGPGQSSLTVDGGGNYRQFTFDSVAASSGTVEITDLTLANGYTSDRGGAIRFYHGDVDVTIRDVTLTDNAAGNRGGAIADIANTGTFTLDGATVSGNTSRSTGGGVYLYGTGDATISSSNLSGGYSYYGGGVGASETNLTISDSTIADNTATNRGGGVYFTGSPDTKTLTVLRSTISGNETLNGRGGGIAVDDNQFFMMRNSTVSSNSAGLYGGGVWLDTNTTEILQSTISGNTAGQAGGVYVGNNGGATIAMSTITDNSATAPYIGPAVDGVQVGLFDGSTAPIPAGTLILTGTIVAGNGDLDLGTKLNGYTSDTDVQSLHSIIGVVDTPNVTVTDLGGTQQGVTSGALALGPLADNGGPTKTHALLAGSVALDAGPAAADLPVFDGSEYDQRGNPYVRVHNGVADVGAYEDQPEPTPPGPGPAPTPDGPPEPTFTG